MNQRSNIKRVLVVEDDESEVFLLNHMFNQARLSDCEIKTVSKISDAVQLLEESGYDLVILDLNLADIKGMSSLTVLRMRFKDTPVIVRSGMNSRKLMDEALISGAQGYLVKGEHDAFNLKHTIDAAFQSAAKPVKELTY